MRIEHVAMYVRDLEAARDFFCRYFGAESNDQYHNPRTDFRSYFLTFDSGARLEIMSSPNTVDAGKSPAAMGYRHLAFSAGSGVAVDRLTNRLREDGFLVLSGPRTTGDGYYESCVVGFEDNLIEITI